jgi:hypothetical protein
MRESAIYYKKVTVRVFTMSNASRGPSPKQRDSDPSASPTFIDKNMPDVRRVHTLGTNTKQFSPHPLASAPRAPPASWMRDAKGSPL